MATIEAEVAFGEGEESRILERWVVARGRKVDALHVIKSRPFQDWDFLVLGQSGLPLAYIEIKMRRKPSATFGDVIAPLRKHDLALKLRAHNIRFLMVTEYPDTLIECDLADSPAEIVMIGRRDRPSRAKVKHGVWRGDQLVELA